MQREQVQYDGCDANLGSGMFDFNGFCLPGDLLQLTLSQNSQMLTNTVNFLNNTVYFLTSEWSRTVAALIVLFVEDPVERLLSYNGELRAHSLPAVFCLETRFGVREACRG